MHSVHLQEALSELAEESAVALQGEIRAGAEVPFELDTREGQLRGGPSLYCYRPLTGEFIAHRWHRIEGLLAHPPAARALSGFDGLDRYLAAAGIEVGGRDEGARVRAALRAFVADVFAEQSEFELRPERLSRALARLEHAAVGGVAGATVAATLHGLTIISSELRLTRGLVIARPEALDGLPEGALAQAAGGPDHLVAVVSIEDEHPRRALEEGRAVLKDLLRSLRLFGDGRVTLGAMAWTRIAGGGWSPIALGAGGRPHGMLIVTPEHEDELRAFCNLVSRRSPADEEVAWALRRYELGCDRESPYEGLTDHLAALRVLLEPEGPATGMLPGRLAALCATPEQRQALAARMLAAIELEGAVIAGTSTPHAGAEAIAADVADHLRALLRDVICGHLDPDLAGLADEILLEHEEPGGGQPASEEPSAEEMTGDLGEAQEVLDLSV
jgi:hypothetical protein